jgi:hypothetical protein
MKYYIDRLKALLGFYRCQRCNIKIGSHYAAYCEVCSKWVSDETRKQSKRFPRWDRDFSWDDKDYFGG